MTPRWLLSLGFLVTLAPPVPAVPGLIDQPQTFPWTVGLAPVTFDEAGGLDAGQGRVKTSVLWFNTYRQYGFDEKMAQQIDMEGLLATVSGAWSPAPGWELRTQLQGWRLGGGLMDAFLAGFHGTLFLPNQGRNLVADGGYRDYLKGVFDETTPPEGITQISLAVRQFSGPWAWTAWIKPPVPARVDWGWTDAWTAGATASWGDHWSLPGSPWGLGLGVAAGAVWAAPEPSFPGPSGGWVPQVGWYARLWTPWPVRGLVQGSWTGAPVRGEAYLTQGAGLLTTGGQLPLGGDWTLELAVTEEFLTWATNEVGFQAGLAWNR